MEEDHEMDEPVGSIAEEQSVISSDDDEQSEEWDAEARVMKWARFHEIINRYVDFVDYMH